MIRLSEDGALALFLMLNEGGMYHPQAMPVKAIAPRTISLLRILLQHTVTGKTKHVTEN